MPLLRSLLWEAADWQKLCRLLQVLESCCQCSIHTLAIRTCLVRFTDVPTCPEALLPWASWLFWIHSGCFTDLRYVCTCSQERSVHSGSRPPSYINVVGHHGSLLELKTLRPLLSPTGSESAVNKILRWSVCTLKLEKHWVDTWEQLRGSLDFYVEPQPTVDLKQTDWLLFLQQKWVYLGSAKNCNWGLRPWWATCLSPHSKERRALWKKGKGRGGGGQWGLQ